MTSGLLTLILFAQLAGLFVQEKSADQGNSDRSLSATTTTEKSQSKSDRNRVLATVGDQPISQADVDLQLNRRPAADGSLPELPESVLLASIHLVAQQRRSMQTLARTGGEVTDAQIDKWLEDNNPDREGKSGAELAKLAAQSASVDEAAFRQLLRWRIAWQRYLAKHATEANARKHFDKNKHRFDGSRFLVEQISISAPPGHSLIRRESQELMESQRKQIVEGMISFADATKQIAEMTKKSQTPSAPIWVSGNGPLQPHVVDSIIELKLNEVSQVIESPSGVHLVRLIKQELGAKKYEDVVEEVRRHMLLYLLDYAAKGSEAKMPLVLDGEARNPEQ